MKKLILSVLFVLAFAGVASAFDAQPFDIRSTTGGGSQAVTNTTGVCLVGWNISCGGACAVELLKHAGGTRYATIAIGAAGSAVQSFANINGCGGRPGVFVGKGLYPYTNTSSTTKGTIWYYPAP